MFINPNDVVDPKLWALKNGPIQAPINIENAGL